MFFKLIILTLFLPFYNEDIFYLDNSNDEQIIQFVKTTKSLEHFDIISTDQSLKWDNIPSAGMSLSPISPKKWFRVIVSSKTNCSKRFSFNYELIPYGKVYITSSLTSTIDSLDFSTNSLERSSILKLKLQPHEIQHIYIELNGQGGSLCTSLEEYDQGFNDNSYIVIMILRTLIITFSIISIIVGIISKKYILYFSLLLYLLGINLFAEAEIGTFIGWGYFKNNDLSYIIRLAGNHLFIVSLYYFVKNFLYPDNKNKELKIVHYYNFLGIIFLMLFLFLPYSNTIQSITYLYFILGTWVLVSNYLIYLVVPAIIDNIPFSKPLLIYFLITSINSIIFISAPHLGLLKRYSYTNIITYTNSFNISVYLLFILFLKWLYILKENKRLSLLEQEHQQTYIQTVVESQEKEKNRIGREIHDSLGGDLSFFKMKLHDQKSSIEISTTLDHTIKSVRSLSHSLVTPYFENEYWVDEIQELTSNFSNSNRIYTFNINKESIHLDKKSLEHLYRIIQELYINAEKHSNATRIDLELFVYENTLELLYQDNGIGITSLSIEDEEYQLKNVTYRVKILSGTLKMRSRNGLFIEITIPI